MTKGDEAQPIGRGVAGPIGGGSSTAHELPRAIISKDAGSVNRLLSALSLGGAAAAAAWRFLMRLPTNPEMLEGIRKLEGFRCGEGVTEEGGEKWEILLGPPGSYRMLYTLQIVDGVLDFVEGGGGAGDVRREVEVRVRLRECVCVLRLSGMFLQDRVVCHVCVCVV